MDYYKANDTIKQAQEIVNRDNARKIATKSFQIGAEKGHEAGIRTGQIDALEGMQKIANMKTAYEEVQRTPPGLPIDPDTASLASDYIALLRANHEQNASINSGLGGREINNEAQQYMFNKMKQMQDTPNNNELIPLGGQGTGSPIRKTQPTPTTLKAMQIAEEALKIGQQ